MVNHIDHDKMNNDASNLEWCSASHNSKMAAKHGSIKCRALVQLTKEGVWVAEYPSINAAGRAMNAGTGGALRLCAEGQIKQSVGYVWKYKTS